MAKGSLHQKNSGFSLLEVMIATAILAMGIMTLQSSWSGSIRAVNKSRGIQTAAMLLKNKITEIEVKYRHDVANLPDEEEGNFENYEGYRWTMKSAAFVPPDFAAILQQDGGQDVALLDIMKKMTSIFEKSLKEMKVTVFYKIGDKEIEYSATTMFVDWDQPIDLMGGL